MSPKAPPSLEPHAKNMLGKGSPRQRILEAARKLFHRFGIKGVGVDAIAVAAQTNKTTLYRHFGLKDELVAEYLRDVANRASTIWDDLERRQPNDPVAQLRGRVAIGAERLLSEATGCDFMNAAVELTDRDHPAKRVIHDFKGAQRKWLADLCRRLAKR